MKGAGEDLQYWSKEYELGLGNLATVLKIEVGKCSSFRSVDLLKTKVNGRKR